MFQIHSGLQLLMLALFRFKTLIVYIIVFDVEMKKHQSTKL